MRRTARWCAYRLYPATGNQAAGSVVLVHGASASSRSMHAPAKAFAAAGFAAYAIDVRGHGASGSRGHIGYIGHLDRDLEDFVAQVRPPAPSTLVGFSAGGGFALRVAGSARQALFDSYLLLAPFVGQDAPTHRKSVGGLVSIGLPRLIAIHTLDAMGVRAFQDLVVTRYPTSDSAQSESTSAYSFALATNFRPPRDYVATIRAARQPVELIVGDADEAFDAAAYEPMLRELGQPWPVTRLPKVGHLPLIIDARAVAVIVEAAIRLQSVAASGRVERPA
jgi:alpha-beta hydrolase superfamily lysophospholipase